MNVIEMIRYDKELCYKLNRICRILHEDGYPTEEIYETAIAIASEVFQMLEGEGTVFKVGKNTLAIRIPILLAKDSAFPFKIGDKVTVKIENDKLTISKR